jgi:hypothetical protein
VPKSLMNFGKNTQLFPLPFARRAFFPGLYNMCVCTNESQKDALLIFHVDLHTAWAFLNIAMKFTDLALLKSFDLSNKHTVP